MVICFELVCSFVDYKRYGLYAVLLLFRICLLACLAYIVAVYIPGSIAEIPDLLHIGLKSYLKISSGTYWKLIKIVNLEIKCTDNGVELHTLSTYRIQLISILQIANFSTIVKVLYVWIMMKTDNKFYHFSAVLVREKKQRTGGETKEGG